MEATKFFTLFVNLNPYWFEKAEIDNLGFKPMSKYAIFSVALLMYFLYFDLIHLLPDQEYNDNTH